MKFLSKYALMPLVVVSSLVFGYFVFKRISQGNLRTRDNEKWENNVRNHVDRHVGKPLILPYTDSLHVRKSDYLNICNLPLKVVNFLDGDCSTCLAKISFWKEFVSELNANGYRDVPVIMYAFSFSEENFRDYMNTAWEGRPWLFDKDSSFIVDNQLRDLRFQTVLLDSENKVVLIGDPLLNPELRKLYMETICSLL